MTDVPPNGDGTAPQPRPTPPDFDDDAAHDGREVNQLAVGDVVVLGDGTTWSLASIGVVAVEVSSTDQINDGRSWTEVLDDEFADGIEPLSKVDL